MAAPAIQMLGAYQLAEVLGTGATGEVHRARDTRTGQEVALKTLQRVATGDPTARARVVDALRAAATIHHPHLAEVLEVNEADGVVYVVTELLGGFSLRTLLQREGGPLPLPDAVDLVRQACEGLGAAHAGGLVHAHLSPDDLLLAPAPHAGADVVLGADAGHRRYLVKVTDVGMVRPGDRGVPALNQVPSASLAYLAPEQTRGQAVDGRTDIYALGVILYEAVTGYPPFQVKTPNEAAFKHGQQPPTELRAWRPEVPQELEDVVLRCLAKTPAERYASMQALHDALAPLWPVAERVAPPVPIARPEPPPPRPPVVPPPPAPTLIAAVDRLSLTLTPGRQEVVRVTVRNVGRLVDHVHIEVEGVPAHWVRQARNGVQLNPRTEEVIALTVLVPRESESRATEYQVTLRVVSREAPELSPAVPVRWHVLPFGAPQLTLDPPRARGWRSATYTARLRNGGNAPVRYLLTAAAQEPGFTFALDAPELTLLNGGVGETRVMLRTPLRWVGAGDESQTFTVRAALAEDAPADPKLDGAGDASDESQGTVEGQFVRRPVLPAWALGPLAVLLVALGWALMKIVEPKPIVPPPQPAVRPVAVVGLRPGASVLIPGEALGDSGTALVNEVSVPVAWTPDSVRLTALPEGLPRERPLTIVVVPQSTRKPLQAGTVTINVPAGDSRADSFAFSQPSISINLPRQQTRALRVKVFNAADSQLTPGLQLVFSSENPQIATVTSVGNNEALVRGQSRGNTRIVAAQPGVSLASIPVTVTGSLSDTAPAPKPVTPPAPSSGSSDPIARPSFILPSDGVAGNGTVAIGPFRDRLYTVTVRLRNGVAVGYANGIGGRGATDPAGRGRGSAQGVEVQLSGVRKLNAPTGQLVTVRAYFDAAAGKNVSQTVRAGALEYQLRLHPGTRILRVRRQPMFQVDSTWVMVSVSVPRN